MQGCRCCLLFLARLMNHLKDIFTVDFNSQSILGQADQRNNMLRNLLRDFAKIDLQDVGKTDLLGNAVISILFYKLIKFCLIHIT